MSDSVIAVVIGAVGFGLLVLASILINLHGKAEPEYRGIYKLGMGMIVAAGLVYVLPGLVLAVFAIAALVLCALVIATFSKVFPNKGT